jgi:hypothetical protein
LILGFASTVRRIARVESFPAAPADAKSGVLFSNQPPFPAILAEINLSDFAAENLGASSPKSKI